MLGLREDVPEIVPALDVVLHTSRREGLPVTVIEAMASGRPVVASDAGGTAELIEAEDESASSFRSATFLPRSSASPISSETRDSAREWGRPDEGAPRASSP